MTDTPEFPTRNNMEPDRPDRWQQLFWLVLAAAVLSGITWLISQMSGCSTVQAQQPGVFGTPKPDPGVLPKCTLVFLQGNLSKVLLQVADGQVLLDTKEYAIEIQPGHTPIATCKLYRGVYRPSNPITKTWEVGEIRFVEPEAFQKLVDEAIANADDEILPKDPEAAMPQRGRPPILPTIPLNPNDKPPPPPPEEGTAKSKTKGEPKLPE